MGFKVSVNISTSTVVWQTFDVNGNVLANGTAATLTAAATAAITSLKASMSSEASSLTGDVSAL